MRVGFTGTREQLTAAQRAALENVFASMPPFEEFHHGCCVGADETAAEIVREMFGNKCRIVGHQPENRLARSERAIDLCDELREPEPYLDRNRNIVDATDELTACPRGSEESRGSGTWATVRHARKRNRLIVLVWPDGSVTTEAA